MKRIGSFLIWCFWGWIPIAVLAALIGGLEQVPETFVAWLICLVPGLLLLAWAEPRRGGGAGIAMPLMVRGFLYRMVLTLAGSLGYWYWTGQQVSVAFWIWMIVFYLLTLAIETWIVLQIMNNGEGRRNWNGSRSI